MPVMTREEVERLLSLFQAAEGQKWRRGATFCSFCDEFSDGEECGLERCLWWRVLEYNTTEPIDCFLRVGQYMQEYGCTPRRFLEKFLVENGLAWLSKVPGEWEILI